MTDEQECKAAFNDLDQVTSLELWQKWAKQAWIAQRDRLIRPEAMLIYEVQLEKGMIYAC